MMLCTRISGVTNVLIHNIPFSIWTRRLPFQIKPCRQSSATNLTNFSTNRPLLNQQSEPASLAGKCVNKFPTEMQPYLRLMRTDKPIGNHHYFISEIILINHILESRYNIHKIFYD